MDKATPLKPRPRKRSCPPHRGENAKHKRVRASTRLKELWADPVWREQMVAKIRAGTRKNVGGKSRFGVPDGMRKVEAMKLWDIAKEQAKHTMSELTKAGLLDESTDEAKEALEAALQVMRSPMDQKLKLQAARLVLEFTKSKPASKSIVAVDEAEQWLKQVANEEENDKGEASSDA